MAELKTLAAFGQDSTYQPDRLFAHNAAAVIAKGITLVSGQVLQRGTVLGVITANGKYTTALSASSDGSQTPTAILAEDTDATGADKNTIAYFEGTFVEGALILGTGITIAAARTALRNVGIYTDISIPY